jgi:hypothetical protein
VSTPTINVNLKQCDCWKWHEPALPTHQAVCAATPVPISCPIQRSVSFEVVLGECHNTSLPESERMGRRCVSSAFDVAKVEHHSTCPARPIRVACSISGETWAESEVVLCDGRGEDGREVAFTDASPVFPACRERWALVKALVTGQHVGLPPALAGLRPDIQNLFLQRDAVYTRLASMRRHEEALYAEWLALPDSVKRRCQIAPDAPEYARTFAQDALECYVVGLIERVGAL